jgi:hypothetical protein
MQIPDLDDAGMLGASMLEEIRRKAQQRLQQIEPLIEEAERLRDVLAVIEERSLPERAPRHSLARSHRDASSRPQGGPAQPRAAKGANKRVIIELIGQRPGITPAEIAQTTGLKRTVVASTVSRLKRYGELRNHELGGVCLAGTAAAPEPAMAVSSRRRRRGAAADRAREQLASAA